MTPRDEKPKLRVSDWQSATPAPTTPAPALRSEPPSPPRAPAAGTAEPPPQNGLDLPVDPFRLLGGLWQRRWWLALGAGIGFLAFTSLGFWRTATRHQVSAQLIKREVPNAFRAGEVGEDYKPRDLSTPTLLGLASSTNVLSRVAARTNPPLSLGLLRRSIEVAEQRGTDYLYLTFSGYTSAQATVDVANIWAEEVVNYTREMQSRESREIRQYLQQELDANAAELERVSQGLLDYTRREGIVSIDKQIDAQLRSIGDLDLRYETSRLEIQSIDIKLHSLEAELARQSPLADELKAARDQLGELRTRYTDENPLVREALDRIQQIEARLAEDRQSESTDLSRFAGTFLGNTLYLQILDLRSQREALTANLSTQARLRDEARAALQALPAKELGTAQLRSSKTSLENTRNLLLSRVREAEVFEQRPPGYYQIFSPASLETVITKPKSLKVAVYGVLGFLLGAGLAFTAAIARELLDSKLLTGPEAAKAWGAPLLARLPAVPSEDPAAIDEAVSRLWSRWLGGPERIAQPQVVCCPIYDDSENDLWARLLDEARRLKPHLLVVDIGTADQRPAAIAQLPAVSPDDADRDPHGLQRLDVDIRTLSLADTDTLVRRLQQTAVRRPVWLRLVGSVREPLSTLARSGSAPLILVPTGVHSITFWREQAALLRSNGLVPVGVVALREIPWHER
jgi:uncharacterized protein involved in exopolysaccharide biosynthesis